MEKKKEKFERLAKVFLMRVAESNRNFYMFLSRENRIIRTIVSRAIEDVEIISIRWNKWDNYS